MVSGKHSIFIHFPKDRNCDVCLRPTITSASCRKRTGTVVPRAEKIGDLRTADHKVLSEGCESYRTWLPNGSSHIRVKQKLHRKHNGACRNSWSQIGNLKSFTLTIPWNSAKPVKISPGIIARLHHTDRRQMGLLKERCAGLKKGLLLYCCNHVWRKNGDGVLLPSAKHSRSLV